MDEPIPVEALAPEIRHVIALHWWYRAHAEQEASKRFAWLLAKLEGVSAHAEVLALCQRAVSDEERHARLCEATARRYDPADPFAALPTAEPVDFAPTSLSPRDRVLYETTAFCAVTEALNAGLLTACLQGARDAHIHQTIRAILADEVVHARLGWAHLAAELQAGLGGWLPRLLPRMLQGTLHEELLDMVPEAQDSRSFPDHGHLSFGERVATFRGTLDDVVLPGFAALGVDVTSARDWAGEAVSKLERMG